MRSATATMAATLLGAPITYAADTDATKHHEAESMPVTHEETVVEKDRPLAIDAGGVSLQFGGFVKLDAMQDFDPIGNSDQFKVNSIPVSGDPDSGLGGSSNMIARGTRFTVDVRDTEEIATGMRAYVEGDFYGSGNSFRIRHAYGEWKGFLAGQTWSTFQDISARPFTLDYEGPDGEVFVRQAMVRYTKKVSDGFQWSVGAENASSQISSAIAGDGRSEMPDLAGTLRFQQAWGHVQIGALLRQLRFVSNDGSVDETTAAYGLNVSGKASVFGSDAIMGHVAFGSGLGRYIESFGGTDSDAYMSAAGNLDAIDAWTAVLGYTHQWNERMNTSVSGSISELDNVAGQVAGAIESARSIHLNFAYHPIPKVMVGAELMWGERTNFDGNSGDAVRLQFSAQYKFR